MAESNAVGTPVIAFDVGAATEVLNDQRQVLSEQTAAAAVERLLSWQQTKRPVVAAQATFRASSVTRQWESFLWDLTKREAAYDNHSENSRTD